MRDYDAYRTEYEKAQAYFQAQITNYENKAFEYGTIVVRNAVLISGGGLLAIPTIVGLGSEVAINTSDAVAASLAFAFALLLSIVGAYVIHINWTFNVDAWRKHWEDRHEFLRKAYLEDASEEELRVDQKEHYKRAIRVTFWLPHCIAILYLLTVGYGFSNLYSAFGVSM
ncbi:MAG: hypothetical protein M5U35_08925 [Roseovarius sp.]|nr:hypothetical protein [Roseovarius sp.]